MAKPATIAELRESGYKSLSVKEEMRKNLIEKLSRREELFPGIVGYDQSVIPQVENAILSGQDIIFLGERGQAKTRMIRALASLLDPEIPVVFESEINDDPFNPISVKARALIEQHGESTPIQWIGRDRRYGEKLATPDITVADLVGEVDPIKVAEGRFLSDPETMHFGLIPRVNRGIFCINELPDLAERIQVAMLNILEERDVQIRGYLIRLPLDVYVVASANPEDYTNRGRIITPLKDRYGSQIRTHYPRSIHHEIQIMEQERSVFPEERFQISSPQYMKEVIAEMTALARKSADVNQRSGVSVRVSISNYENLISNAVRRGIRNSEEQISPRVSDMPYLLASTAGKIEFETLEEGREDQIIEKLGQQAVLKVFNRHFELSEFDELIQQFKAGFVTEVGDVMGSKQYVQLSREVPGLKKGADKLEAGNNPATVASAVEFILEGLHLNKKLNKDRLAGKTTYRG